MATQITATTPRTRPFIRFGVLEVAILAVIAAAVLAVAVWTQTGSGSDVIVERQSFGVGYPLHGGLAGPSRVGQAATVAGPTSAVDVAGHFGPGYPLHGGLAGPSQPMSAVDVAGHYGPGYPLSGGLAGPSQVGEGD